MQQPYQHKIPAGQDVANSGMIVMEETNNFRFSYDINSAQGTVVPDCRPRKNPLKGKFKDPCGSAPQAVQWD